MTTERLMVRRRSLCCPHSESRSRPRRFPVRVLRTLRLPDRLPLRVGPALCWDEPAVHLRNHLRTCSLSFQDFLEPISDATNTVRPTFAVLNTVGSFGDYCNVANNIAFLLSNSV